MNVKKPVEQMTLEELASETESAIEETDRIEKVLTVAREAAIGHAVRIEKVNLRMEELLSIGADEKSQGLSGHTDVRSMMLKEICAELDVEFNDFSPRKILRICSILRASRPVDNPEDCADIERLKRYTKLTNAMVNKIKTTTSYSAQSRLNRKH